MDLTDRLFLVLINIPNLQAEATKRQAFATNTVYWFVCQNTSEEVGHVELKFKLISLQPLIII